MSLAWYNGFSPSERAAAGVWRRRMVKAGLLALDTRCLACSQDQGVIHQHLEDYSRPFAKERLLPSCFRCHLMIHLRGRWPEEWDRYRGEIGRGIQYAAVHRAAIQVVVRNHIRVQEPAPFVQLNVPLRRFLDEIHHGLLRPPARPPSTRKDNAPEP